MQKNHTWDFREMGGKSIFFNVSNIKKFILHIRKKITKQFSPHLVV